MASSSSSYLFVLIPLQVIINMLFIQPAFCADQKTQELIEKICRQMEEFGFCDHNFLDDLPSPSKDIVCLTKITLVQVLSNATNTHTYTVDDLLPNATDPALKNVLIACENAYRIVVDSFQKASNDFKTNNYRTMIRDEQRTPRAQASCVSSFETPPNPPNPLADRNRQMRILIAMALVSAHELNP